MKLKLNKFFAPNTKVDEYDTRSMKRILNRLGYYMPPKEFGSTHIPDRAVFEALKAFQKDNNLLISGELRPGDDTEKALNEAAENQDPNAEYIWHTQQDDRVRKTHAEREGETFTWGNPPADGHPGEPYNCRCWAEKKKKRKCFDNGNGWKSSAFQLILQYEKNIEWPYLDTKCNITIGIGNNVNAKNKFMNLPLRIDHPEKGPLASKEEKEWGYQFLQQFAEDNKNEEGELNIAADYFENITSLRLSEDISAQTAREQLGNFIGSLVQKFPDFSCYPDPAKIALTDMIFNIGATKFNEQTWIHFFPAVRKRDWHTAASESSRSDVDTDRNEKIHDLFIEAARIEEKENKE